jgi:hypothetical protein
VHVPLADQQRGAVLAAVTTVISDDDWLCECDIDAVAPLLDWSFTWNTLLFFALSIFQF